MRLNKLDTFCLVLFIIVFSFLGFAIYQGYETNKLEQSIIGHDVIYVPTGELVTPVSVMTKAVPRTYLVRRKDGTTMEVSVMDLKAIQSTVEK